MVREALVTSVTWTLPPVSFHKSQVSGYIHFKDLGGSTVTSSPSVQSTPTPSSTLSSSGTYTFTSRHGIKNAPQQSSSDIAYYDAGSSVRYDKTVISDGYEWLSYISYSGARRYIAIRSVGTSTTATSTTASSPSIASSGRYTFTKRSEIKNILRLVVRKSPTGENTHYFFHSQDDKVEVSC